MLMLNHFLLQGGRFLDLRSQPEQWICVNLCSGKINSWNNANLAVKKLTEMGRRCTVLASGIRR